MNVQNIKKFPASNQVLIEVNAGDLATILPGLSRLSHNGKP